MEAVDHELIRKFSKSDKRLDRLYRQHRDIESRLIRFSQKSFMTTSEEQEVKRLKKIKLKGVDRMMMLVGGQK